jgi:uncharacterized protein YihD (DUF1040 family)
MKYLTIFLSIILTKQLYALEAESRFESELKYLEQEALITDEVKLSNSAILKEVIIKDKKDKTEEENIFFKTEEIRPRRVRSR